MPLKPLLPAFIIAVIWTNRYLCFQLSLREEELQRCQRERDEAVLREQTLEKKVHDLELEAEKNTQTKDDKSRQTKLMEVNNNVN